MKCPKVGCLHWLPRGRLYIGVHGGFTRVVVKRLGNKMTRLTPLFPGPGETAENINREENIAGQCNVRKRQNEGNQFSDL